LLNNPSRGRFNDEFISNAQGKDSMDSDTPALTE